MRFQHAFLTPVCLFILTSLACAPTLADDRKEGNIKLSRLTEQLIDQGFTACSADLDKLVKFVHPDDNSYAMHSTWSKEDTNRRSAVSVSSSQYLTGENMVTTFVVTPDASGKCSVVSTQILTSAYSCTFVREAYFPDWKLKVNLDETSLYEDADEANLIVYLTPTSKKGCVIVKQSTVFDAAALFSKK